MMARNRYSRRRSVCMWTFPWNSLRMAGECIGSVFFLACVVIGINIVALL